jgi:replication-associated recombination protein RarA
MDARRAWYVRQDEKRLRAPVTAAQVRARPTLALPADLSKATLRAFAMRLALRTVEAKQPRTDPEIFDVELARELLTHTALDADEATLAAARTKAGEIGDAHLRWETCAALWADIRNGAAELVDRALYAAARTVDGGEDEKNAARAVVVAELAAELEAVRKALRGEG